MARSSSSSSRPSLPSVPKQGLLVWGGLSSSSSSSSKLPPVHADERKQDMMDENHLLHHILDGTNGLRVCPFCAGAYTLYGTTYSEADFHRSFSPNLPRGAGCWLALRGLAARYNIMVQVQVLRATLEFGNDDSSSSSWSWDF